jgi:hypothetical protein
MAEAPEAWPEAWLSAENGISGIEVEELMMMCFKHLDHLENI